MAVWQLDPRYEQPPAELRELLDLVLGDLQSSEPIAVQVGWDPHVDGPNGRPCPYLIFSEPGVVGGAGWTPDAPGVGAEECGADFTPAALAVGLADYLQEQFFPETVAAWGQARPRCPGHSHPAAPQLIDGDAWWTCPRDGHALARLGTLGSA